MTEVLVDTTMIITETETDTTETVTDRGTGKDGTAKDYYTLECLLYLLRNITLQHPVYVRQAASEDIPIVRRPDRKDLLGYLKGEVATAASIDRSAPLEMPTQVKRGAEDSSESAPKRMRDDTVAHQKLKDQLAMKYGAQQAGDQSVADQLKPLSDKLDINKIAEIKKKILSNRRTRIKMDGDEGERGAVGPWDAEADRTKEIISRERQWRTRTTILQSNGKQFAKNIFAILTSVKAREEGRYAKPAPAPGAPGARPGMPPAWGFCWSSSFHQDGTKPKESFLPRLVKDVESFLGDFCE